MTCSAKTFLLLPLFAKAFVTYPSFHRQFDHTKLVQRKGSNLDDPAQELTNTLARLDRQWKIQQASKKSTNRWKTLSLDDNNKNRNAYWLSPSQSQSIPSCVLVFVGGAGLGSYPQIAYNELLIRLSDRLNAACLTVPYQVGLDHFGLAQTVGEDIRLALELARDQNLVSEQAPVYCLAHSLGAKLMTIHMAATNEAYDGMGWISFNNFGFGRTIGMAKDFAKEIRDGISKRNDGSPIGNGAWESGTDEILGQVFNLAESAVAAMGIDFAPTSEQMEKLIDMKFQPEWRSKTRLFTFDQDKLQNTLDFYSRTGVDVSELPGTHLTPVFFSLSLDQIPDVEAQQMAREAMGGIEKASFGNEEELNELVNEISLWILGRGPSQRPVWQRETPQIEGSQS